MDKILITLDFGSIKNSHIKSRTYKGRDGEVTRKELNLEVVPLKESKVIKDADTWQLVKTHFVAIQQTKEEREQKLPTVFVGEGKMFIDKNDQFFGEVGPGNKLPI